MSFRIESRGGVLKTTRKLNRDTLDGTEYFNLTLVAADNGAPVRSIEKIIRIFITDENDNDPIFSQNVYAAKIHEGAANGNSVQQVTAIDQDENPSFSYSLASGGLGFFSINSVTGLITTTGSQINLDYGILDSPFYSLIITVADGQTPPRTSTCTVYVQILPVNDHEPVFDQVPNPIIAETTSVGSVICTVRATDSDYSTDGEVKYVQGVYSNLWNLDPITGEITLAKTLNYENVTAHEILIEARDQSATLPKTATATVIVNVTDVSDEAPSCESYSFVVNLFENVTIAEYVSTKSKTIKRKTLSLVKKNTIGWYTHKLLRRR